MNYKLSFLVVILTLITPRIFSQIPAIAGGLGFSSGIYYNSLITGNPAFYGKVYFKINKQMKLVPGLTIYSPKKKSFPALSANKRNYMFQGDADLHYSLYKDDPLRLIGFFGINTTSVLSRWDINEDPPDIVNKGGIGLGLNLGGAINMFIDNSFDAYISGKYILSSFNQFVINIGLIYYPEGLRRKGGW